MSQKIKDRPDCLDGLPFYNELPQMPVSIDIASTVHDFLAMDVLQLDGLQPIECRYLHQEGDVVGVNPSENLITLYESERVEFQVVSVVVNAYGFEERDGVLVGKPYSISLNPWAKRGRLTKVQPDYFRHIDFEMHASREHVYIGFNPFTQSYDFYGEHRTFVENAPFKIHTDMVGFVFNTYALASKWHFDDLCLPAIPECNSYLVGKYKKYRARRYYKKFENTCPRKVWGCDSPIELFLLHALNANGFSPEIQTALFEDGSTHPTLHQMISSNKKECEVRQITDADFYFPDRRLAVFCDSSKHHRSKKSQIKDAKIDDELNKLGITSLRIKGKDIVHAPYQCVERISEYL